MGSIKKLDNVTIARIAAGEVIERPASVVKECLENALDAGASKVKVEIEDGGKRRIRITDNGSGMSKDDIIMAPVEHATSKISSLDDIEVVGSYGFRGEALASIAHVAKLTIISSVDGVTAYKVVAVDGGISDPEPTSHPKGSTIEVNDLFQELPVRQKFLKRDSTEAAHIYDIMLHTSLIHADKDFILISNGVEMLNSSGITDQATLIAHVFGPAVKDKLLEIDTHVGDFHFKGHISSPDITFGNRQKQVTAINRRIIKSPIIQKALTQSFRDLIPSKRFPLVVLNVEAEDRSQVDVNVHPQKMDVKFLNPGLIFDAFPKVIKVSVQSQHGDLDPISMPESYSIPPLLKESEPNRIKSFSPLTASYGAVTSNEGQSTAFSSQLNSMPENPDVTQSSSFSYSQPPFGSVAEGMGGAGDERDPVMDFFNQEQEAFLNFDHFENNPSGMDDDVLFFQVFDTYIVMKADNGLWIIDQHAVHERILYERIKEQFGQEDLKQPLLIAEVIDLTPDLFAVFQEEAEQFKSLNFEIEEFGEGQIVIREIPAEFADVPSLGDWVKDILLRLKEVPGSSTDAALENKEDLQMKACKAAIKAGKRLSQLEIKQLVKDFQVSPQNFTCPHGRPLYVSFSKSELEKRFLRT